MDTFAHGLWSCAAGLVGNRKLASRLRFGWVLFWGVFPDLFAFGLTIVLFVWYWLFGGGSAPRHFFDRSLREALPVFLQPHVLYRYSHSLVIILAVLGLVWVFRRPAVFTMLAWPLHVLMDIPSHRAGRYGTPFLWPLSAYKFDGVSWGQRWFMILNYSAITLAFVLLLVLSWRAVRRRGNVGSPGSA